jgi:4-amino-4-deoxychorismate lyase
MPVLGSVPDMAISERIAALVGGDVVDAAAPLVRADDLGVLRGDGCFESALVRDGEPVWLDAHLDRLAVSAARLELPTPDAAAWRDSVGKALDAWGRPGEAVLRLIYTRGPEGGGDPTGYVLVSPLPANALRQRAEGVNVLSLPRGVPSELAAPWLLAGVKALSYALNMAALRHARAQGADDVIYTSAEGRVLEAPTATVVWAYGRTVHTIPVTEPILAGITVRELFQQLADLGIRTASTPATVPDLLAADGVWLLSSARRIAAVRTLDGQSITLGSLDSVLRDALRAG